MPSATQVPEFQIPVVDISAYLQNPSSPEAQHVVDSVRAACTTSGFFQLKGHEIPADLVKATLPRYQGPVCLTTGGKEGSEETRNKQRVRYDGSASLATRCLARYEGGNGPVTRIFSEGSSQIVKGYYIGKDIAFEDEQASRSFMTPNVWPSAEQVPESSFKKPMVDYYEAVEALCFRVLELVAAALPYGPDALDELKGEPIVASMRLLHYHPQKSTAEKQFGAGAHTDFGVITLLLTDGLPGLQVQNQTTGQWVSVPPDENAFVVNVGDILQQITGGYFKSNLHRVLNLGDADRYSVPYVFAGCLDARLKRLDGADEDRILTVEEHMLERFATTYSAAKESRVG